MYFWQSHTKRRKPHTYHPAPIPFQPIQLKEIIVIKDTHREKAPSNKTPVLRKSTNMGVWAVVTLNQLFIRGS